MRKGLLSGRKILKKPLVKLSDSCGTKDCYVFKWEVQLTLPLGHKSPVPLSHSSNLHLHFPAKYSMDFLLLRCSLQLPPMGPCW